MSKQDKKIIKLFTSKATSIDDDSKTVRFQISDDKPDRMGEIVDQKSWDLKSYKTNPIVLWGHDPSEPENVLGKAEVTPGDTASFADISFATEVNEKAALVWKMVKAGILNCVSVGFIPHSYEMKDDTPVLVNNELLEISIVPIPANPRAIALSYKAGEISQKDATHLIDLMTKEAAAITEQLKAAETTDEAKTVEELQTQLDEAISRAEAAEKQRDELKTAQEAADEEDDDTEEQVTENEQPSANDGDDDQSGADDDEFDLDAELTPEMEARINEELAKSA